MATARMTNELRDTIRNAAMSKAFAKEKAQNEESLKKLSRKIYDRARHGWRQNSTEIWPEGEKFVPDWAKNVVKSSMLPAVCIGNLNDLLSKALGASTEVAA